MRRSLRAACVPVIATAVAVTTLAAPSGAAAPDLDYVALGDSYASGTGTRSYFPESGSCLRSPLAYPVLWAQSHETSSFTFAACSGARVDDLVATQLGPLSAGTDLVTVSIGGNDAGFAQVMVTCQVGGPQACDRAIDAAEGYITTQLPGRLDNAYTAIEERAGAAEVVVLGYPQLFEPGPCISSIDAAHRARLNTVADRLAAVTADRAGAAGFTFADTRDAFAGHRVCAPDPWLNGPAWPVRESYHPDRDGHALAFLSVVDALTEAAQQD